MAEDRFYLNSVSLFPVGWCLGTVYLTTLAGSHIYLFVVAALYIFFTSHIHRGAKLSEINELNSYLHRYQTLSLFSQFRPTWTIFNISRTQPVFKPCKLLLIHLETTVSWQIITYPFIIKECLQVSIITVHVGEMCFAKENNRCGAYCVFEKLKCK